MRKSGEMKARALVQRLENHMARDGFFRLKSLVETIFDPKMPCFEKAEHARYVTTIDVNYWNKADAEGRKKLKPLEKILISYILKEGYFLLLAL